MVGIPAMIYEKRVRVHCTDAIDSSIVTRFHNQLMHWFYWTELEAKDFGEGEKWRTTLVFAVLFKFSVFQTVEFFSLSTWILSCISCFIGEESLIIISNDLRLLYVSICSRYLVKLDWCWISENIRCDNISPKLSLVSKNFTKFVSTLTNLLFCLSWHCSCCSLERFLPILGC